MAETSTIEELRGICCNVKYVHLTTTRLSGSQATAKQRDRYLYVRQNFSLYLGT